jgi:hypothetical protein
MKRKLLGIFIMTLFMITGTLPTLFSKEVYDNSISYTSFDYIPGTYLIDTEWEQWGGCNNHCPMNECDPDDTKWYQERVGCWAVAIGQIINYHSSRHPDLLQSTGRVNYDCSQDCINPWQIRNNLDEFDYDWSKMVNIADGASRTEKDNISRLLYDTATVIQKDFGTKRYFTTVDLRNGVPERLDELINELIEHFPAIDVRTYWDPNLTEKVIKKEINNGTPIMFYTLGHNYSGVFPEVPTFGHAFVIDGYDYYPTPETDIFIVHLNYGFGDKNPYPLADSWFNYYGNFPYKEYFMFDFPDYRKGLIIKLTPWIDHFEGPIYNIVDGECVFTISCEYDSNPPMFYMVDWEDGTPFEWLGPYQLGQVCTTTHSYSSPGIYDVTVKAKNYMGSQSDWSEPITIHITRDSSLIPIIQLLLLLKDLIPSLEPYLTLIIWLLCT